MEAQAPKTRFERIYYVHRHAMLYVAQHILKEQPLAENAVQEAFLRVLHHMKKIHDPVSHKTRAFLVMNSKEQLLESVQQTQTTE